MSTSVVPAVDQENAAACLGNREKLQALGSQGHHGDPQTRTIPIQKQFVGTVGGIQKSQRSFGEISNRLERGNDNTRSGVFKEVPIQSSLAETLPERTQKEVSEQQEFIPHITEVEDYSDIFPSALQMSKGQLNKFSRFWESCLKPNLRYLDSSRISSSPPRDLTLLRTVHYDEEVSLKPVLEDAFDLPPPWE